MKSKSLIISVIALMILSFSANGQVTNFIKKRKTAAKETAAETTGKEVDKKIGSKINKGILNLSNKILNNEEESTSGDSTVVNNSSGEAQSSENGGSVKNNGGNALLKMMSVGGSNVKHNDTYGFDNNILMEIKTYDEENSGIMYYGTHFNSANNNMAMEIKSDPATSSEEVATAITMIFDDENQSMITLTDANGQKMAIITTMVDEDETEDSAYIEYDDSEELFDYKKSGRTKKILGYNCSEYVYTNENEKTEYWVTTELDFKLSKKKMEKSGIPIMYDDGPFEGGFMMEMRSFSDSKLVAEMLIKEVNVKKNSSISLSGYNKMSIDLNELEEK